MDPNSIYGEMTHRHPVFNSLAEPHYEIAQCNDDPDKKLIISPRVDGVFIGTVDLEIGEWHIKPIGVPYRKLQDLWQNFRAFGRVYSRILDDPQWNGVQLTTTTKINDENDELALTGGGVDTKIGIKCDVDGNEAFLNVGENATFMVNMESVLKTLSEMVEGGQLTERSWDLIRNHHPTNIAVIRQLEIDTRPPPSVVTEEWGARGINGIIRDN